MILESKQNRESSVKDKVAPYKQNIAWAFIVCLDMAIIFYIYLFAIAQSSERQAAWFQTFIVWLVLDIFVMSTTVTFLSHILIPMIAMGDLRLVKDRLKKTIKQFVRSKESATNSASDSFNVAKYLFVSYRLAERYPELQESQIISKFNSPWPHHSYQRVASVSSAYRKRFSVFVRSAAVITVFFLKGFLILPGAVQDMVLNLVATVVSGNILLLFVKIYDSNPVFVIFPVLLMGMLGMFLFKAIQRSCMKPAANSDKASTPFAGRRRNQFEVRAQNTIIAPSASPALPAAVVLNRSTAQGRDGALKTRRQSVSEGLGAVAEMQSIRRSNNTTNERTAFHDAALAKLNDTSQGSDDAIALNVDEAVAINSSDGELSPAIRRKVDERRPPDGTYFDDTFSSTDVRQRFNSAESSLSADRKDTTSFWEVSDTSDDDDNDDQSNHDYINGAAAPSYQQQVQPGIFEISDESESD
jgi:hypothetical protein